MGLQHKIETDIGIPATYFHIQSAFMYYRDKCADVTVSGFVDEKARRSGKAPVYSQAFRMDIDDKTDQSEIYAYIKTLEPFKGATDQ